VPSTSGRRITWPVPRLALPGSGRAQGIAGARRLSRAGQAPQRQVGAGVASLHLARSTNIDSRFSVGGSRSALQASSSSSSARRQTTKLASSRPLAEQ
jgi:hypothetical protein